MGHTRLFRLYFLTIILSVASLGSLSCVTCNRRAVVSSISPDSATAGGEVVLTVNGSYFVPNSIFSFPMYWVDSLLQNPNITSYRGSSELIAQKGVALVEHLLWSRGTGG
jgi:hypothetical protein